MPALERCPLYRGVRCKVVSVDRGPIVLLYQKGKVSMSPFFVFVIEPCNLEKEIAMLKSHEHGLYTKINPPYLHQ